MKSDNGYQSCWRRRSTRKGRNRSLADQKGDDDLEHPQYHHRHGLLPRALQLCCNLDKMQRLQADDESLTTYESDDRWQIECESDDESDSLSTLTGSDEDDDETVDSIPTNSETETMITVSMKSYPKMMKRRTSLSTPETDDLSYSQEFSPEINYAAISGMEIEIDLTPLLIY